MATIRKATLDDVDEIVSMSAEFYPTTHYADFADMDEDSVSGLVSGLIERDVFLVAEDAGKLVGMVALVIAPFMFNQSIKVAAELVWWVSPSHRGTSVANRLLSEIEPACKERGASRIQMVHMPNSPPQAAALYERAGYFRSEISYTKDI